MHSQKTVSYFFIVRTVQYIVVFLVEKFGFETKWEIDQTVFAAGNRIKTDTKFVEGLSGVKWYLECNPDEYGYRSTTKYISFYFHIDSEINVEAKLYFQCSNEEEDCRYNSCSTGHKKVELRQIPHEEFFNPAKYFISCGKVLVGVYGSFSYTEKPTNCYSLMCNPTDWKLKLLEKLVPDFDIIVANETIKVTKLLLAAESDVFERMFESNFVESHEQKVLIHGYMFNTIKNAIDYCYGKDIGAFIVDEENAIELLLFTNQYNFITLKPKMEQYFISKLSLKNIELFALVSDKANAMELRQSCVNFVQSLFNTSPKWPNGELPEFDPKFMRDVVSQALTKKM